MANPKDDDKRTAERKAATEGQQANYDRTARDEAAARLDRTAERKAADVATTTDRRRMHDLIDGKVGAIEERADVEGYFVAGGRGVTAGNGTVLGEYTELLPEHEIGVEKFESLLKAGYIRKGIGKSPRSIHTADERPEIRENLSDTGKATKGDRGKRVAKRWNFKDEQLAGKDLDALNTLIVERGGEPQETTEEAIVLLQSETD